MSATDDAADALSDDAPEAAPKKRSPLLAILIFLLVLIVAGGGGAYWFGFLDSVAPKIGIAPRKALPPDVDTVVDVPLMIFTLLEQRGRRYQMSIKLEMVMRNDRDAGYAKAHMPRIKDTLNIYLRELRLDDLRDRGGLSRL
ncbi:MAG: flagellar basal body-associated FliL family protein, partial [Alphaproteobacteria bacterium]|nr:flagellar basal body-associated FliL family protein [Alphaproteobacteria bacterium]